MASAGDYKAGDARFTRPHAAAGRWRCGLPAPGHRPRAVRWSPRGRAGNRRDLTASRAAGCMTWQHHEAARYAHEIDCPGLHSPAATPPGAA